MRRAIAVLDAIAVGAVAVARRWCRAHSLSVRAGWAQRVPRRDRGAAPRLWGFGQLAGAAKPIRNRRADRLEASARPGLRSAPRPRRQPASRPVQLGCHSAEREPDTLEERAPVAPAGPLRLLRQREAIPLKLGDRSGEQEVLVTPRSSPSLRGQRASADAGRCASRSRKVRFVGGGRDSCAPATFSASRRDSECPRRLVRSITTPKGRPGTLRSS